MPNGGVPHVCPRHGQVEHALGVLEERALGQAADLDDVRELAGKAGAQALATDHRVSRLSWIGVGITLTLTGITGALSVALLLLRLGWIGGGP